MQGIQIGWTAPTVAQWKTDDSTISNEELTLLASSSEIGRIFGPILAAIFVDKLGRKYTLALCSLSFFILWLIIAFSSSIILIGSLRLVMGITKSINIVTAAIYIAENCTPRMRGLMGSLIPVCVNIAVIIENLLITYTSSTTAAAITAALALCGFSTSLFLKETPYFLAMKNSSEAAKKNLMWLRGKTVIDSEVESEMDKINENIQLEILKKKSSVSVLTKVENYKSLLITIIFNGLFVMTGYYPIISYTSLIFKSSSTFSSSEYTTIAQLFPLVISIILPFIIERYDRRTLLLWSSILLVIGHACAFLLYSLKVTFMEEYFSWIIFAIVGVYLAFSNLILPMLSVIAGELLPMSVKAMGNSLGSLVYSIGALITMNVFLPINEAYGIQYNFIIYLIASALLFVFILMVIPETRGKSLVDIQNLLKAKTDAKR